MLQQSIGKFDGKSQIGIGNIHSIRFDYNKTLLASRSPHVTIGNIWLPYNTENKLIDCYFNLTPEIICLNSIGENVLQRLSGADFDSDTVLLTDNEILIRAAKRNYHLFKTPTSFVSARKVKRYYTPEQQSDLDIKTSVNKIGEIINLSQELNSLLWDRMYHGETYDDIKELYYDICQLPTASDMIYRRPIASAASNNGRVAFLQGASGNKISIRAQYGKSDFSSATFTASSSDIRLKEDVKDSSVNALSKIMQMQIREFNWKQTGVHQELGCVADELELIDPLLTTGGGYDDDGTMNIKSIDTLLLSEYAIKGIQELYKQNKHQQKRIEYLESQLKNK